MCGMVGAVAERDVSGILLEGLKRLEYRGYDSAGLAALNDAGQIDCRKQNGKVAQLEQLLGEQSVTGRSGIAHTRWATHGVPEQRNAHPHMSGDTVAIVHNGIVENCRALRAQMEEEGYVFVSDTDSEVIAHLVHWHLAGGAGKLLTAVRASVAMLEGSYGLVVLASAEPGQLVAARHGSPVVVGVGIGEYYLASDTIALRQVTDQFIYLEDGDVAQVSVSGHQVVDQRGATVERPVQRTDYFHTDTGKGDYSHFAEKEIFEQPAAMRSALEGRVGRHSVYAEAFGIAAPEVLAKASKVLIVACGSSYHAGMVARYWIESLARVPCQVEIASEYRYRQHVLAPDTLLVCVSQSGETADTLAVLQDFNARQKGFSSLAICNRPQSSLVRDSSLTLLLNAGHEISVASTKAFTAQLVSLTLLALALAQTRGMTEDAERRIVAALATLPGLVRQVLALSQPLHGWARQLMHSHSVLFVGRGTYYPIALEGALKMKELSYVHAEGYPAGELKHGPLALVSRRQPVVAVLPNNDLLDKMNSNLEEIIAREGQLFLLAETDTQFKEREGVSELRVPEVPEPLLAPIVHNVALQLLAYHLAVLKGTDIDQPRNLAKSVTVE